MTFDARSGDTWRRVALLGTLATGAGIRLWQYGANPSLWLDEAALARNIVERSPRELLLPLDHGQVAPIGFLLLQKLMTALLGGSEPALRLLPLACGLASLLLFTALARKTLEGRAVVYAVLVFATAQPFVYFSSQAKQYGVDVAA